MITDNKTVLKITSARPEEGMTAVVTAEKEIKECSFSVTDKNGVEMATGTASVNGCEATASAVFDADMWSVESPALYTLTLSVVYADGTSEEISDKFGFRYFSTDSKYIYLNGYPFYMRAYIRGAAAHEHQNNCNLSDYDFYKKNIEMAKSYGFNTIRFHSVIPPEACFRAADDLGILIHIEMRKKDDQYNNLKEMLEGKKDFIGNGTLLETIKSLYNHPSLMVYCIGNEIREPGKTPRVREICDIVRKNDPTRLFLDTCAHGEYDRDYVDFDVQHMSYFFPFGKNADMFENTDNLLCFGTVNNRDMVVEENGGKIRRGIAFPRPLIAHEVCHYASWRDFYALKEKFAKYGRPEPWWIDEEIKMIEAKGYKENFAETLQITKDYQFRCWKAAFEAIRSSKLLSGFHMLQFADTDKYENSNGVVDCFDDPHGISPEEFRKFNADTVLLARLPKRVYACGETAKIPVLLSQYMINPPAKAVFSYSVADEKGKVYHNGTLNDVDTRESGLYNLCGLEFSIPDEAVKMILSCRLDFEDGTSCENSWEMWSMPSFRKLSLNAKSDMKANYLDRVCEFSDAASLTITDTLDDAMFEKLENGEDVMLIYRTDWTRHVLNKGMTAPKYSFRHVWERYKGVIWDRGTINGGPVDKETLNKFGFVTDGQINHQYYNLIEDSDKINLDDFPVKVNSIVSGLDKCNRDRFDPRKFDLPELMYDRTMRNFTYAFDLKVGKGRLLVTGMNFTKVDEYDPSSCTMLKALVDYCNSDSFGKGDSISAEELKTYLSDIASSGPQKERMMTQYWQLDEEPVESKAYWEESERYLREDE